MDSSSMEAAYIKNYENQEQHLYDLFLKTRAFLTQKVPPDFLEVGAHGSEESRSSKAWGGLSSK